MKAVLISIQPKWCALIAQGKKTIEMRKTQPKIDTPFKCYIYCTKTPKEKSQTYAAFSGNPCDYGGKIIGEFICDKIHILPCIKPFHYYGAKMHHSGRFCAQACLEWFNMEHYLGRKTGYAWHISNLIIYDNPKELYEFVNYDKHEVCLQKNCFGSDCWQCPNNAIMVRPPQSWCYVKE